jgi:hypothetical protein
VQDGRIPHRKDQLALPARSEGHAGRVWRRPKLAIERGWLWLHESGTYVKFTQVGAELFA